MNGNTGDVKIGDLGLSSYMDHDNKEVISRIQANTPNPSLSTRVYRVVTTRSTRGLSSCTGKGNKEVPSSDAGGIFGVLIHGSEPKPMGARFDACCFV